ncbi:pseudo histidine-containing phosphotransfer protein 2-like isoform X3 [Carya illinoinensis]|uniref:pseudo histidine-containing phosphotransfer protein 2-like isoform X3 n=1 Tax=Carya illinoinensis TaxID=32201 RepID=UPI001C7258A0|nr:pseudo histidine-containing phosphotransfer protein 2-like isoform X3 [Carya illinoinensis]
MDVNSLAQQIASVKKSLFDEQILNDEFSLVEEIFTPYFVETIIIVYFDDSSKYIDIIEQALMEEAPLDLAKLDEFLNLLKRCSRFGAQRLPIEINKVLECCNANDKEGSKAAFQMVKEEYTTLKDRLDAYIELTHRAQIAGLSKRSSAGGSSTI